MTRNHDFARLVRTNCVGVLLLALCQTAVASETEPASPFLIAAAQIGHEAALVRPLVALAGFSATTPAERTVVDIVEADLLRGALLRVAVIPLGLGERDRPDLHSAALADAHFIVTGQVTALPDGQFDARFRLWEVRSGLNVAGQAYTIEPRDLRLAAHRIADAIQLRATGVAGQNTWRVLSIEQVGGRWQLNISDVDGHSPRQALRSLKPLLMPAWPESAAWGGQGTLITYFSYEHGDGPSLWVQELASGRRKLQHAPEVLQVCLAELERAQAAPENRHRRWLTTQWTWEEGDCKKALYTHIQSILRP